MRARKLTPNAWWGAPETHRCHCDTSSRTIDDSIALRHARLMRGFGVLVLGLTVTAGCARTFHGSATQPNPLAVPNETLRSSERITIVRGDMELEAPDPAAV